MASAASPRIAVIKSNEDILETLQLALEEEGYDVATAHVRAFRKLGADLEHFMERFHPQVILWDLAPPYEENWRYFQTIKDSPVMQGRPIILTSTNERRAREIVGEDEQIVEIIGKPFDLNQLLERIAQTLTGAQ